MSKIVYICLRKPSFGSAFKNKLEIISERITPDNIKAKSTLFYETDRVAYGIINPTQTIKTCAESVLLGTTFGDQENWWELGSEIPDGSYALFRGDNYNLEVITDVVASRTIWYYKNEEIFIASSSQRAVIMLMQKFDLNTKVIPWILSTGGLGPFESWDARLSMIPPDSILKLNKSSWELQIETRSVDFAQAAVKTDDDHEQDLNRELEQTFQELKLDFDKWVLPLSGGFDSRAILLFLIKFGGRIDKLKAITWGLKNSLSIKDNDAFVAKKLADHLNVRHHYYNTDFAAEPLEDIIDRYLVCGEGRIDHISGYMDGFKIWQTLFNDNVQGIIRGEECMGGRLVDTALNVRSRIGISLCSDFANLKDYQNFGIESHEVPSFLQQRNSETLEEWRDRIYNQYRMPVILAALNDLKLPYVEIINPLLARKVVYKVRELPDRMRTKKVTFKRIVNSMSPNIEYANSGANSSKQALLSSTDFIDLMKKELSSKNAQLVFQPSFIKYVTDNLSTKAKNRSISFKAFLASFLPAWLRRGAKSISSKPTLDYKIIAFRMFMAIKMNRILREDALVLKYDNLDARQFSHSS